ncbi:hypothetical protein OG713_42775 [Streptomyces sp. NBC_00723]
MITTALENQGVEGIEVVYGSVSCGSDLIYQDVADLSFSRADGGF